MTHPASQIQTLELTEFSSPACPIYLIALCLLEAEVVQYTVIDRSRTFVVASAQGECTNFTPSNILNRMCVMAQSLINVTDWKQIDIFLSERRETDRQSGKSEAVTCYRNNEMPLKRIM